MEILKIFLPEIFLFFCILYQIIFSVSFFKTFKVNVPCLNDELYYQVLFILICLLLLCFNQKFIGFSINFVFFFDNSSKYLKLIFSFILLLSFTPIWCSFINQKINFFEFFILILLSVFGLMLLINSFDLIPTYLILELQALCFYVLSSFCRTSSFSTEAGLKYFILGSFISGIFLFGCLLIYALLGTTNFHKILLLLFLPINDLKFTFLLFVGFFLISLTFLFKLVVAPFHFWAPDVYDGSPLASTIFFSLIPKISLFVIFMRWLSIFLPNFQNFGNFLLFIGLFSVFWGAYFSISQKRFKRFILYSSISQIGFLIIGLSQFKLDLYSSVFFFLFFYLITSIIIWGFLANFYKKNLKKSNLKNYIFINPVMLIDLSSFFRSNIVWSISLLIIFFSFAGIPPFTGFLSKVFILLSLIREHTIFFSTILILISVLSSFYYLRVIKIIFFEKTERFFMLKKQNFFNIAFNESEYIIYAICLLFLVLIFFYPAIFILISNLVVMDFF